MFMGTIAAHEELRYSCENFLQDHRALALASPEWCNTRASLSLSETVNAPGCGCEACRHAQLLLDLI